MTYGTGGRWGEWSSGGGSSLELIDPHSNHRLAANWADSDETQKSVWTDIENTGVLDNGANYETSIDYAQIGLLDVGECLVDNIEVDYNGTNYVSNGTFETGTNGWTFQGDMAVPAWKTAGMPAAIPCTSVAATGFGPGTIPARWRLNTNSLAAGQTATLRFKARWLHGWPEPLLRLEWQLARSHRAAARARQSRHAGHAQQPVRHQCRAGDLQRDPQSRRCRRRTRPWWSRRRCMIPNGVTESHALLPAGSGHRLTPPCR